MKSRRSNGRSTFVVGRKVRALKPATKTMAGRDAMLGNAQARCFTPLQIIIGSLIIRNKLRIACQFSEEVEALVIICNGVNPKEGRDGKCNRKDVQGYDPGSSWPGGAAVVKSGKPHGKQDQAAPSFLI